MQQFTKQLCIILLFIQSLVIAEYAINKASALHREVPYQMTVNNDYNSSNYQPQFPNNDWYAAEAINPIWFQFSAVSRHRQIVACTCSSEIDAIIGIYYYYQDQPVGFLNDDRTVENLSNSCFLLSSFVSLFIPKNTEFYVIIASFDSIHNLGGMDLKVYEDFQDIFPTQVLIDALRAKTRRLTDRINGIIDESVSVQLELATQLEGEKEAIQSECEEVRISLQEFEGNALARIDAFQDEILSSLSNLSDALDIHSVISDTEHIENLINELRDEWNSVLSDFLSIEMKMNYLQGLELKMNINYQDLDFNHRFNQVDSVLSLINQDTDYLQLQFANLQIAEEKSQNFLKNQIFAKYLLAKDTKSRGEIPMRYRTPAKYLGNMEEVLEFVVGLYNEKTQYCQFNKRSAACLWFTDNTRGEYVRLMREYTASVDNNQFFDAFAALQRFYEKLYPAWSQNLSISIFDTCNIPVPTRPGRAIKIEHYRFRALQ